MVKTIIAPVIALLALLAQVVLDVEIPKETIDSITLALTNVVAGAIVVYGIVKQRNKKA